MVSTGGVAALTVACVTMTVQVAAMFPINALRNAGFLLAATTLVATIDVDMLIGSELSDMARDADRRVSDVLSLPPALLSSARRSSRCTAAC